METWIGLDQNYIDSLLDSMQRRIAQCIERPGVWLIINFMQFELSGYIFIVLFQNDDIVANWKIKRIENKLKSGFFGNLIYIENTPILSVLFYFVVY